MNFCIHFTNVFGKQEILSVLKIIVVANHLQCVRMNEKSFPERIAMLSSRGWGQVLQREVSNAGFCLKVRKKF